MATDLEKIRVLIRDPAGASQELSDDDITTLLEIESDLYRAAAAGARNIAAKYATKVDISAGGISAKNSQRYRAYLRLAQTLDNRARGILGGTPEVTGVSLDEMATVAADPDRPPSTFHSNPS